MKAVMKKWRWIIYLSLSTAAFMAGGSWLPQIPDAPVWAVFLLVFGIFWAGYACAHLDQEIGGVHVQVGVRHFRPFIKVIKQ